MEEFQGYVGPSEKYVATMEIIKKKGFFVDAEFGGTITYKSIRDFYVAPNDMPHVLVKKPLKNNPNSKVKTFVEKGYKIIRYSGSIVIGIPIKTFKTDKLKKVAFRFTDTNDKESKKK